MYELSIAGEIDDFQPKQTAVVTINNLSNERRHVILRFDV